MQWDAPHVGSLDDGWPAQDAVGGQACVLTICQQLTLLHPHSAYHGWLHTAPIGSGDTSALRWPCVAKTIGNSKQGRSMGVVGNRWS